MAKISTFPKVFMDAAIGTSAFGRIGRIAAYSAAYMIHGMKDKLSSVSGDIAERTMSTIATLPAEAQEQAMQQLTQVTQNADNNIATTINVITATLALIPAALTLAMGHANTQDAQAIRAKANRNLTRPKL